MGLNPGGAMCHLALCLRRVAFSTLPPSLFVTWGLNVSVLKWRLTWPENKRWNIVHYRL